MKTRLWESAEAALSKWIEAGFAGGSARWERDQLLDRERSLRSAIWRRWRELHGLGEATPDIEHPPLLVALDELGLALAAQRARLANLESPWRAAPPTVPELLAHADRHPALGVQLLDATSLSWWAWRATPQSQRSAVSLGHFHQGTWYMGGDPVGSSALLPGEWRPLDGTGQEPRAWPGVVSPRLGA